jgi:hypothetical protein
LTMPVWELGCADRERGALGWHPRPVAARSLRGVRAAPLFETVETIGGGPEEVARTLKSNDRDTIRGHFRDGTR